MNKIQTIKKIIKGLKQLRKEDLIKEASFINSSGTQVCFNGQVGLILQDMNIRDKPVPYVRNIYDTISDVYLEFDSRKDSEYPSIYSKLNSIHSGYYEGDTKFSDAKKQAIRVFESLLK